MRLLARPGQSQRELADQGQVESGLAARHAIRLAVSGLVAPVRGDQGTAA